MWPVECLGGMQPSTGPVRSSWRPASRSDVGLIRLPPPKAIGTAEASTWSSMRTACLSWPPRRGGGTAPDRESRLVVTRLVHTPEEAIEPVLICGLPLGALALASALFVTLTEVGRYGFLSLLVPLYVRLTRSQVLDHFVRGQIYEYIKLNPGDHYSSIRRELSLSNGLLAYHLSVLEKQNFVKSQRDGKLKRFYPVDMTIPRKKGVRLSDLQVKMLRRIDKNPSITQGQLAGLLGVSRQTVNHNIKLMERAGVLESERDGGSLTYRVKSV